jgi:hypothetical protein
MHVGYIMLTLGREVMACTSIRGGGWWQTDAHLQQQAGNNLLY